MPKCPWGDFPVFYITSGNLLMCKRTIFLSSGTQDPHWVPHFSWSCKRLTQVLSSRPGLAWLSRWPCMAAADTPTQVQMVLLEPRAVPPGGVSLACSRAKPDTGGGKVSRSKVDSQDLDW